MNLSHLVNRNALEFQLRHCHFKKTADGLKCQDFVRIDFELTDSCGVDGVTEDNFLNGTRHGLGGGYGLRPGHPVCLLSNRMDLFR